MILVGACVVGDGEGRGASYPFCHFRKESRLVVPRVFRLRRSLSRDDSRTQLSNCLMDPILVIVEKSWISQLLLLLVFQWLVSLFVWLCPVWLSVAWLCVGCFVFCAW